jgi:hypothetical protein
MTAASHSVTDGRASSGTGRWQGARPFIRHMLEMTMAMIRAMLHRFDEYGLSGRLPSAR